MARTSSINLFRHGYERCAAWVIGRLIALQRMAYVYVAPDGAVHCGTDRYTVRAPTWELIGAYTTRVQPEMVEDDLLDWLREQTRKAA